MCHKLSKCMFGFALCNAYIWFVIYINLILLDDYHFRKDEFKVNLSGWAF